MSTLNNQSVMYCIEGNGSRDSHRGDGYKESDVMYTLNTVEQHAVCCEDTKYMTMQRIGEYADCGVASSLKERDYKDATDLVIQSVVRRLTPQECCLLQGFPKDWLDIGEWIDEKGKKHKDSDAVKYRAAGNSIALPFWQWLANRIVSQYEGKEVTIGSLFDGISGFPLVFSRAGAKPIWSSEIEPFCIAVAEKHFGE